MIRALLILGFIFELASCITPRMTVKSAAEVKPEEVVLVGSLFLEPKLTDVENQIRPEIAKNKVYIKADPIKTEILPKIEYSHIPNLLTENWGQIFYIPVPRSDKIYFNGIYTYVYNGSPWLDMLIFPVRGVVNVPKNQKYLYIGAIHIRRNDFSEYKSIRIQDDYAKALPDMKAKFPGQTLDKSIVSILLD